jgi:menaquinone-9 beta-reductase
MKPITIIGGGLAGLTLGIGLRKAGIPVTVWEAGHYPRHRVCGEFISGRGQEALGRLGLIETLNHAGTILARTARFVFEKASTPVRQLPTPAMCLSRFSLDALLAGEFRQLGGELRVRERWRETNEGEGVVRASGRQARPREGGGRWFGLKVHARNISLAADLEMHAQRNGYVGLSWLPGGEVNVCGLFRAGASYGSVWDRMRMPNEGTEPELRDPRGTSELRGWFRLLSGEPGAQLHSRLAGAVFDEDSFCSVAGLSFRPQGAAGRTDCCIGDALTMTPPATGNGMSMAFEGAELALGPLTAWSRNEISWPDARETVARACDTAFSRRLSWARWLQWMMFAPAMQTRIGVVPLHSEWLWQMLFARTR